ncbi:GTP-binding protein [Candidatus Parvarchaeota archaeon]|nr:GTP-binding protein [Candidatus Parvarchaeota archaeon]
MDDPLFGIGKLDSDLNGLPPKKIALFSASPSVGNEVFGYQMIHENLVKGKKVLLYLNRTSPQSYKTEMKEYNLPDNGNLVIIDSYSGITGIQPEQSKNIISVSNPYDRTEVKDKIETELKKGYDLFLLDSVSLLADFFDFEYAVSVVDVIKAAASSHNISAALLLTDWGYTSQQLDMISSRVNVQIDIKGIEKRVIFGQYFAIIKCDWIVGRKFSSALFKSVKPGGIKIYFPKILVTGPTDAGKTSFIHTACKDAVSVDRIGGTIALDHGNLDFEGYKADLFGTPGQERFDPLLKLLGGESIGVILIVDSSRPEQFPRAIEMLRKTETYGLPVVVVANKADLPGAISSDEIREKLHLDMSTPLVQTVAEDKTKIDPQNPTKLKIDGVRKALESLFDILI